MLEDIEFEYIGGIKVDRRISDETKEFIRTFNECYTKRDTKISIPESSMADPWGNSDWDLKSRLEHDTFSDEGCSLFCPDPFTPLAILYGADTKEIDKRRIEKGYHQEFLVANYYADENVTNEGWKWITDIAREVYPHVEFPRTTPKSFEDAVEGIDYIPITEEFTSLFYPSKWSILANKMFFVCQGLPLDEEGRAPFPNITKIGLDRNLNFNNCGEYIMINSSRKRETDLVYFESDPKLINFHSKRNLLYGDEWEIFDPEDYRIEFHPEWGIQNGKVVEIE